MDYLAKASLGSLARVPSNNTHSEGLIAAGIGDPNRKQVHRRLGGGLSLTLEAMPMIGDGSLFHRPVGVYCACMGLEGQGSQRPVQGQVSGEAA